MNNLITQGESLTMSSTQLSELTRKRSDSVKRTIETLSERGLITFTQTVEKATGGRPSLTYHVNERDSYVVVAQLSPEFTAFLVDEWQNRKLLPSPTQLALMVIEAEKEKAEAQQEVARLQGVCNTITAQFAPGVTAPKFCKQLNGVNTQKVNSTLVGMGILLRRKDGFVPASYARDRYFIERQEEHNDKLRSHSELTLIGAKWLYRAYLSNKLPMKADWDNNFVHVVFEG